MKKSISLIALVILMSVTLAACGSTEENPKDKDPVKVPETIIQNTKPLSEYLAENNSLNPIPHDQNPTGLVEIFSIPNDDCGENPDGPCGFETKIMAPLSWESNEEPQEFYFAKEGGAGLSYYGPFTDSLEGIIEEARQLL